jgi:hypothetical protein
VGGQAEARLLLLTVHANPQPHGKLSPRRSLLVGRVKLHPAMLQRPIDELGNVLFSRMTSAHELDMHGAKACLEAEGFVSSRFRLYTYRRDASIFHCCRMFPFRFSLSPRVYVSLARVIYLYCSIRKPKSTPSSTGQLRSIGPIYCGASFILFPISVIMRGSCHFDSRLSWML